MTSPSSATPRRFGGATLVAAGILLSRVAGLVRQRALAHFLGSGDAADVLAAAFRIPNLLQNLFGEGVLSASLIPVYAKLRAEGRTEEAGRVAGAVGLLLGLVTLLLVVIGILATPWLVPLLAPGFTGEKRELTVLVTRIVFPGVGLLVMSAWCLGILNAHRRFFLSYVSPVAWNLAMIGTVIVVGPSASDERLIILVAWASVAGSALQLALQLPMLMRLERELGLREAWGLTGVRTVVRNFGTVMVGRGVVQISGYVDTIIASLLAPGALATLLYAQTISMLPVSLFGMSVSAAELPAMSSEVGSSAEVAAAVRQRLARGLRRIAYFVIPSAVVFLLLGDVTAATIFQTGAFTAEQSLWVWGALAGSALGLLSGTMGRLYSSASYALGDPRTPFRAATIRVAFGGLLGWVTARSMPGWLGIDPRWGVAFLTASAGLAAWVELLLLRRVVNARVGVAAVEPVVLAKLWGCALLAGGVAMTLARVLPLGHPVLRGAVLLSLFGVLYLGLTRLFGFRDALRS